MKTKLFFLILFLIIGYFAWQTVDKRYVQDFAGIKKQDNSNEKNETSSSKNETQKQDAPQEKDIVAPEVSWEDCANGCEKFQNNQTELAYCENFCELENGDEVKTEEVGGEEKKDDCSQKTGLEKDYCLKDKAITEKNQEFCEEIKDDVLRKACNNRVLEDLLE